MDTPLSCCHVKDKLGYGREHRSGIYRCPYSYGSNNVPVEKELGISVFTRHTKDKKPVLSIEDERFLNVVQEFCQNEQKSCSHHPYHAYQTTVVKLSLIATPCIAHWAKILK